jgi:hypothetical protein
MKRSLLAALAAAFLFAASAPAQFVPSANPVFNQNQKGRRNGTGNGTGQGAKSGKRSGPQDCTGAGRTNQGRGRRGGQSGRR